MSSRGTFGYTLWMESIFILMSFVLIVACEEQKEHTAPAINDRDSISKMTSYGVNTLISDSGVIKYRIVTERWDVNTIKNPSHWTFDKGIFLEQFDEKFHVEGYIQADTAWYYDQLRLWKLRGRVRIRNIHGLVYTSEELYWDGIKHEFYSNCFSKVVTPERTLQGTYFRSNENMTHYFVSNSKGSFTTEDLEKDSTPSPSNSSPTSSSTQTDTTKSVMPLRPIATKRAATPKTNLK